MSNQQLIDKYTERNQKIKDYIDNRPTMGVVDIELSDYIIGLENDTLTNSFYNVFEEQVYKTNNPNKEIVLSYQGCGGIFQTDNKVHVISYAGYHTVDKRNDVMSAVEISGLVHLFYTFNRNICELDDYFIVFWIFNPNAYLLINKHTDDVIKIPYNGASGTTSPYYCNVKDNDPGMFNSQLNQPLTNGTVIWGLPGYAGTFSAKIVCLVNFLNGNIYETSAATTYCFAAGAICSGDGNLYIPYNSTTTPPITSLRKYTPTTGLPFTTINLPNNLGLFIQQCQGFKLDNFIFYLGYDTSVGPNKIHIIKINTNDDSVTDNLISTQQFKSVGYSLIFGLFYDEVNYRLYITYNVTDSASQIAFIDLNTLNVTLGPFSLPSGSDGYFAPGFMKRSDENGIVIMTQISRGTPNYFYFSIINNDLTSFRMQGVSVSSMGNQYPLVERADYFDTDDEYIYVKPYGSTELIRIDKGSRNIERVPLPSKSSYNSQTGEPVKVVGEDNVLILPAWEYKEGIVNHIIEDESLTPGKTVHVLDPKSGLNYLIAGNKIYFGITAGKYGSGNPDLDQHLERITLSDSAQLIYVWNGEEVPYKY